MKHPKEHIIFRIFSIILVVFVLLPSTYKLSHAFSLTNHKHEVCLGEKQIHLHSLDVDCEFHKFKISNPIIISPYKYETGCISPNSTQIDKWLYNFKYNHQQLPFSLRGPPELAS